MAYRERKGEAARPFSKSQIRKLGSRLRNAEVPSKEDVAAYIAWSQGFEPPLSEMEVKVRGIAEHCRPSGEYQISARIKQVSSVRAKLIRQRTSLSDLEDIAGCRVVLPRLSDVDRFIVKCAELNVTRTRDDREESHNGYRAVHFTLRGESGLPVELQVRTRIQHAWAQMVERAAASEGMDVKYGGGPGDIRELLHLFSKLVRLTDLRDYEAQAGAAFVDAISGHVSDDQVQQAEGLLDNVTTDVIDQERSLLRLWTTLFSETGAET